MRRSLRCAVGALALIGALAGCSTSKTGSGSAAGSSGTGSSGPAASATAASTAQSTPPLTQPQLQKLVLQDSDLPAGWTATPYTADPNDTKAQDEFAACVGVPTSDAGKVAEAHSADYAMGQAGISSSAESYSSKDQVDRAVAAITSPKASGCFQKLVDENFQGSLPSGATIANPTVTVTPGSGGGPANVVATGRAQFTVNLAGQSRTVQASIAFIRGTRIEAEVDLFSVGAPIDQTTAQKAIAAVATRVATAG